MRGEVQRRVAVVCSTARLHLRPRVQPAAAAPPETPETPQAAGVTVTWHQAELHLRQIRRSQLLPPPCCLFLFASVTWYIGAL